jgi:hypothetical protein
MLVRQLGPWRPNGTGGAERCDAWDVARADVRPAWREEQKLNAAQHAMRVSGIEWRWGTFGAGGYTSTLAIGKAAADAAMHLAGIEFPLDNEVVASDVRPGRILRLVSEVWGVDLEALRGPRRTRKEVQARQVAMFLLRRYTGLSLVGIGTLLGGRDHTTVIHAVRKIEADPRLLAAAEALVVRFGG